MCSPLPTTFHLMLCCGLCVAWQSLLVKSFVQCLGELKPPITLTEGQAKALLRQHLWSVDAALKAIAAAPPTSNPPPPAKKPSLTAATAAAADHKQPQPSADAKTGGGVKFDCLICLESFERREGTCISEVCGHWICSECWSGYLTSHIRDGAAFIRCPGFKCVLYVEDALVQASVDHEVSRLSSAQLTAAQLSSAQLTAAQLTAAHHRTAPPSL
jgi:hypothetical protein